MAALKPLVSWIVVFGVAVGVLIIGSSGRVPFTDWQLATSRETRTAAEVDFTPLMTRPQAISLVTEHIKENCNAATKYLPNADRFEAKYLRYPRTNDHHERDDREWTVTDPMTGAYWRLYEETGDIVPVIGDC